MEYRDGIKIMGDKMGTPCTHSTVYKTCHSQPKRTDNTSPISSNNHETAQSPQKQFLCVEMRRSHWGAFTNKGLARDTEHMIEVATFTRVTAASATACPVCYRFIK